jgi:ZIP family zinc transporter
MGILQSISAGVMIHMTCFHLIPESNETIGTRETMSYFFIGAAIFVLLELVIMQEHSHDDEGHDDGPEKTPMTRKSPRKKKEKKGSVKNINEKESKALYRTSLITFVAMALHNIPEGISVYLSSLSNPKMVDSLF